METENELTGREKSLSNLKPPVKGEVRNPHGSKGKSTNAIINLLYSELLNNPARANIPGQGGDFMAKQLVEKAITMAINGDSAMIITLLTLLGNKE
jgi:hypothetical protein